MLQEDTDNDLAFESSSELGFQIGHLKESLNSVEMDENQLEAIQQRLKKTKLLQYALDVYVKGCIVQWVPLDSGNRPQGLDPDVLLTTLDENGKECVKAKEYWYEVCDAQFYMLQDDVDIPLDDSGIVAWAYLPKPYKKS